MKLLKPVWVHHDDKPIFSVDVHQECLKFATGGQGMDSGRIVIWNLLPVLSEKDELDDNVPKILCQMDNHLACVNCVRWSHSGQTLASGSDDKLVMIWRKSQGPSGVFGTGGIQKNPESWKCISTLRGHSGDVLDVAWSPQDRWLASCSIDNTIIVWDAHAFPAITTTLRGHSGLVKGVAWDPVGKFLASQSDDRSVKIWKTRDWTCNNTIREPFEECGGTTHILRLSWSPDGQYLVSAHAMNGGGPTAQIIEREGWKCDKDFVGHRKAVTCVRFHNAILKRQAPKTQKPQQYCCLAVGSRDRSLSVWMTALQRPLVVIHELFNDSILDLSWGPEKYILMACSGDGTVACLQFSENELGTPLSEEDKHSLYQRIYGKSAVSLEYSTAGDTSIENPELVKCLQDKLVPPSLPSLNRSDKNNCIESNAPTLLPPINGSSNEKTAQIQSSTSVVFSRTAPMRAINKQVETRTADGKRRITPVFIPLNQDVNEMISSTNLSSYSRPSQVTTAVISTDVNVEKCVEPNAAATDSRASDTPVPKPLITEQDEGRLDSRLVMNSKPFVQPPLVNKDPKSSLHCSSAPAIEGSAWFEDTPSKAHQASTIRPKITITNTSKCEFQKDALDYRVHVQNGFIETSMGLVSKITTYHLTQGRLWEMLVGSPIVNFNFCTNFVILCSLDASVRLLDMRTGSLVFPAISLDSAVIQCAFCPKGRLVGVVTECGILRIWNIETCSTVLATKCSDICGKHGSVTQFIITEHGVPFVSFANGESYSYSQKFMSWLVLNSKDPVMRHGLQTSLPKDFQKDYLSYPLTSVQASTNNFSQNASLDINEKNWQSDAKIAFIENEIKLCEAINSPNELRYWYSMLAFQLALSGTEARLRRLLNDLLGSERNDDKILIVPKHELMEVALNVLKPHVCWQGIYTEYNEMFQKTKTKEEKGEEQKPDSSPQQSTEQVKETTNIKIDDIVIPS